MKNFFALLATAALAAGSFAAHAQSVSSGWQARADVLSAGLAAHVVVQTICQGGSAGQQAIDRLMPQLTAQAGDLATRYRASTDEVQGYLFDAANLKIKALLSANRDIGCQQTGNLRAMAGGAGYPL